MYVICTAHLAHMTHSPCMLDQPLAVISHVHGQFVVAKPVHCMLIFCWMNPGDVAKLQQAGLVFNFMYLLTFFCAQSAEHSQDLHASTTSFSMSGM